VTAQTFSYSLALPATQDPYPTYKRMRDEDPAHFSETERIWVLTRFDDCLAAFSDWEGEGVAKGLGGHVSLAVRRSLMCCVGSGRGRGR